RRSSFKSVGPNPIQQISSEEDVMPRIVRHLAIVVISAGVFGLPAIARAQGDRASIVGLVQDSSGAVLPGVNAEASSPVLIEQTRSPGSGGAGRYAIVDLRPGTYTVTFSLPGFRTVKREGIVLE